jgi:hypothetical protein
MAQQGSLSTNASAGSDITSIDQLLDSSQLCPKVYAYFSTCMPVTLHGKYGYFYADEMDLTKVKTKYFPYKMRSYFDGIPHGLYSLNGVSIIYGGPPPEGDGGVKYMAFTVRKKQILFDAKGVPSYFKPNDVGLLDWKNGWMVKILQGDDYFMPPIDALHLNMDNNGGPESPPEEVLCVSFSEEWTYLTGNGIIHANDEDIVCIEQNNPGEPLQPHFEVIFRGYDIGIYDLDAFSWQGDSLCLSVKTPVLLAAPPWYTYAEDGDVICVNAPFREVPPSPYYVKKLFKGAEAFIYDLDALHVQRMERDPELD